MPSCKVSSPQVVVVVDGYSAGKYLHDACMRRGLRTVHVRSTDEWLESMAAPDISRYDDSFVLTDLSSPDAVISRFSELNVGAVLPGQESAVRYADVVSNILGTPHNILSLSEARRNKFVMQDALRDAGVPCVNQIKGNDPVIIADWADKMGYPVVVKPVDSAGSDGVFICSDRRKLVDAIDCLLGKSNIFGDAISEVVAQEYLVGREYIVDTVSLDGEHYVCDCWLYNKKLQPNGRNLYDSETLVDESSKVCEELFSYARQCLDAVGVNVGPAHLEIILTSDGPRLVEVGARLNGNLNNRFSDLCVGRNQADLWLDAIFEPNRFKDILKEKFYRRRQPAAVFHGRSSQSGRVLSLDHDALSDIYRLPSLFQIFLKREVGDIIERTEDLMSSSCKAYLCAEREEVLFKDVNELRELVKDIYKVQG